MANSKELASSIDRTGQKLYELAILAKEFIDADKDVAKNGWNLENETRHYKAKSSLSDFVNTILSHTEIKENKMGNYYGVVRNTSPSYIRASFGSEEEAKEYIAKQEDPDSFHIVRY